MSDALINNLQKRVDELTSENAELKVEAKTRRLAGNKLKEQLEARANEIKTLTADRDTWKTKAEAAPSEQAARITELEGQILDRDHKDAFVKLYGDDELKLNPKVPAEWLMKIVGHKAEGTPDLATIRAAVAGVREAHPYLFGQTAGATPVVDPRGSTKPPLNPPAGGGRGAPETAGNAVRIKKVDFQNPAFTLNPKNKAMIAEAQKAGTLEVVD